MTNTVVARGSALATLKTHLQQVTSGIAAPLGHVYMHEPEYPLESRLGAIVYKGSGEPPEGSMTLGNRMHALRFDIFVYWAWGGRDPGHRDDIESELMDVERAIVASLVGDSNLGGNVTVLYVGDTDTGYIQKSSDNGTAVTLRVLTIPIELVELEGEAIAL